MTVGRNQDVLEFHVSVDGVVHVQVLQGQANLGDIEAGGGLREAPAWLCHKLLVEVALGAILKDVVELLPCLEGSAELDDERTLPLPRHNSYITLCLSTPLCLVIAEVTALVHRPLLYGLHCVKLPIAVALYQFHLTETPLAKQLEDIEIVSANRVTVVLVTIGVGALVLLKATMRQEVGQCHTVRTRCRDGTSLLQGGLTSGTA
mmetsp:Transcript_5001/g.15000  ORF Transcript_5001/g.15000 Transcript_5001/m.15000 type:complete len:205 (-) Transcript_5001:231-845(-)